MAVGVGNELDPPKGLLSVGPFLSPPSYDGMKEPSEP